MNFRVVVDRFEGDFAVLELAAHTVDWPRAALPAGAKEGSIFLLTLSEEEPVDPPDNEPGSSPMVIDL
jgi:hypothetical protein